jgi:hypothetical protein
VVQAAAAHLAWIQSREKFWWKSRSFGKACGLKNPGNSRSSFLCSLPVLGKVVEGLKGYRLVPAASKKIQGNLENTRWRKKDLGEPFSEGNFKEIGLATKRKKERERKKRKKVLERKKERKKEKKKERQKRKNDLRKGERKKERKPPTRSRKERSFRVFGSAFFFSFVSKSCLGFLNISLLSHCFCWRQVSSSLLCHVFTLFVPFLAFLLDSHFSFRVCSFTETHSLYFQYSWNIWFGSSCQRVPWICEDEAVGCRKAFPFLYR